MMGKRRNNCSPTTAGRFFKWIRSELPEDSDSTEPVLLLGVSKLNESPSVRRRTSNTSDSSRYRTPKSKHQRGHKNDARLERIRTDLLTHKADKREENATVKLRNRGTSGEKRKAKCITLNCVGEYDTLRSNTRDSFVFQRPEDLAQISGNAIIDFSENSIENRFSDLDNSPKAFTNVGGESAYKSESKRSGIISNLNERFRKTLSLDSKTARPKSAFGNISPKSIRSDDPILDSKQSKRKKFRPKTFFALESFFDSKKCNEDTVSSQYKKFDLPDDSPLLNRRNTTPDLLTTHRPHANYQLNKLEKYFNRRTISRNFDDVEYIEPIDSVELNNIPETRRYGIIKADSILELDKESVYKDSESEYEVLVKRTDSERERIKGLIVKIMDKSIDSIGSCSLDVDGSTEMSDTTSGSLNLLTPSSTGSRVPDFTKGIQERASTATTQIQEAETPKPDTTSQRSSRSQKKPSYLHLACSINGYNNLTKYDSKLRKDLNKSREASPIRPITFRYSLVVPVPVSADKLIVRDLPTDERCKNLTYNTPDRALTDHYHTTTPVLAYMAAENKQLKKDFLSSTMDNVKDKDQVDHAINSVFKSSYSETNIIGNKYISKKRVETVVNGVSKRIEITKENGEDNLSSPIKSFIQQRVERLYGPGALAQGFFNQKRLKNINPNDCISDNDYINNDLYTKVSSESLPVLRHLRPEFRAQLPIISPKKNVSKTPPKVQIIKVEIEKNGHDDEALLVEGMKKNGVCEKDGHFFLDLKKRETDRLLALSARAESELEQLLQQDDIDEEVYGFIRSAAGKARLLATQKMQQFEGLCYNNINRRSDDMFPTTCEDLEGFWDMVMLQVHHVDALFKEMDEMRSRGWVVKPPEKTRKSLPSRPSSGNRKPDAQPIRKSDGNNAVNEKSRAAAEKRDRERKAMMEHRRKLIKEKQMLSATTNGQVNSDSIKDKQDVEIFVGKQNGKSNGTTS